MTEPIRPSEVQKWTRCPQKWYYEDVEGWRPAQEEFRPEMLMGTALHAGMAQYWNQKMSDGLGPAPEKAARDVLLAGCPLGQGQEVDGLLELLTQVVVKATAWCASSMSDASPLMVEWPLGPDGKTTPDLITREPAGLVVTDWKYHHYVKPEHMIYRLEGAERSHQFLHYIWAVGEYLHEPVRLFRAVHISGMPKITIRETTFMPDAGAQKEWLRQAEVKWRIMHKMRRWSEEPYRNENGCKPYGDKWPCPMWAACWECHGDTGQMSRFYVKKG